MTGLIYLVRLQVFLGVVALGFENMQEYTHHSCNWVFVLTPPLEWNRAVTFRELFIPQGHSTRDVWICQESDRKTETTIHTSRSCRVLAVSKGNSHGLFPLGKNRKGLRAFSHPSTARSRAGSQGNTGTPIELSAVFSFRKHNDNNAVRTTSEAPVMYQLLCYEVYTHRLRCSKWSYRTGRVLTLQMNQAPNIKR